MSLLKKIYLGGEVVEKPHASWQTTKEGLLIGYHVEGGENFNEAGAVPLSMTSLRDEKLLFLCSNSLEWYPEHLVNADASETIYKVLFRWPGFELVFNKSSDYHTYREKKAGKTTSHPALITLPSSNDIGELSESFLIHPTKYVVSIEAISKADASKIDPFRHFCEQESFKLLEGIKKHISRNFLRCKMKPQTVYDITELSQKGAIVVPNDKVNDLQLRPLKEGQTHDYFSPVNKRKYTTDPMMSFHVR